jgi:hypothetical protein
MVLKTICPPALIYLVFSITQVAIDTMRGMYNLAFIKIWVALVFTILLNYLCLSGLGVVSWLIVFIPFILMTIIVSMLLFMFGLDPATGKIQSHTKGKKMDVREQVSKEMKVPANENKKHHHKHRHHNKTKQVDASVYGIDDNSRPYTKDNYSYITIDYDRSKISKDEKKVLTDMVQKRTNLSKDPLQRNK